MSDDAVPTVGLDQADAAELAELCAHAPDAVGADLDRYAATTGCRLELRDELLRLTERLETLEPKP